MFSKLINKSLILILVSLIWFPFFPINTYAKQACETRGFWLDPFRTQRSFDEVLTDVTEANLNTIFLLAPPTDNKENWGDADPDSFLYRIKRAKEEGLSVHAWIINRKRSYYDGIDQVDFTDKDEIEAQADWVESVFQEYGNYIDGIHFDYIRYSWDGDSINEDGRMDSISKVIETSFKRIKDKYPQKYLTAAVFTTLPVYEESYVPLTKTPSWHSGVPQWYRDWFMHNRGNQYDPFTSNDGTKYIGVPSHIRFQQNPVEWIKKYPDGESTISGIMPMQYTLNQDVWEDEVDQWKEFIDFTGGDIGKLYMGIGWLTEDGHNDWGYDEDGVVDKIRYGREKGLKGFVIYSFGHDDKKVDDSILVDALKKGPYKDKILSCLNPDSESVFSDIENSVFESYITNLYNDKVISGYSDGSFKPEENITRGALAKFIVNAFNIEIDSEGTPFPDVSSNDVFYRYIQTLKNINIINGFSDGKFYPDQTVKRGDVTKFIVNTLDYKDRIEKDDYLEFKNKYPDVLEDNRFILEITILSNINVSGEAIIKGYSDGNYMPNEPVTRGAIAKMVDLSRRIVK